MKLSELIQKNNEELSKKYDWRSIFGKNSKAEKAIISHLNHSQHSLLDNILEYIEGEKKVIYVGPQAVTKNVVKKDTLQLIEDYIREALTKQI